MVLTGPAFAQTADANSDPLAGFPTVSVEACVAAALRNGPGVRAAKLTLNSAQETLIQSRAKQGLTVGESGGYFYSGTSEPSGPVALSSSLGATEAGSEGNLGNNVKGAVSVSGPESSLSVSALQSLPQNPTDNVTSFGFSGSQVLWDGYLGGTTSANVRIAENAYKVAFATEDAAVKTAIYQVQGAYFTLLGDQKTLLVRQATLKQAQENLRTEQGLFQNQLATDLDVLQMKVIERQAELDLRTALNQVTTDRKSLSILLGWPLEKTYTASDESRPAPAVKDEDEGVRTAMAHRSELLTFEAELDSARVTLDLQKTAYSPVLSLTGSLGAGQDWTAANSAENFSIGVNVALPPVWDGGASGAEVRQASDQISTYEVQRDQERQTITVQVQNDWFAVQDTKDRLDLAVTNVQQAQGQYDLEKLKLSVGLETTLDVLTAFTTLITAEVGLEQAKSNYILAVLTFNNVLGL
jgi:outer membrane protein